MSPPRPFPFRPWVRSTCRRAMGWGGGVLLALGVGVWLLRSPEEGFLSRPFEVLLLYGAVFWLTLFKIWWTAGLPAVVLHDDGLSYQPLHTFRPRRIAYAEILACAPREGTESLRFVVKRPIGPAREFFLNLAVVGDRHRLLDVLGERLSEVGLEEASDGTPAWRRPDAPP